MEEYASPQRPGIVVADCLRQQPAVFYSQKLWKVAKGRPSESARPASAPPPHQQLHRKEHPPVSRSVKICVTAFRSKATMKCTIASSNRRVEG